METKEGVRILGRTSVDILKTGGFKVSALEVEETLRTHRLVGECAVVGVDDESWGQVICAAVERVPGGQVDTDALQEWAKNHLAPYKVPRRWVVVDALPRNAMGKVMKPEVTKWFQP